MPFGRFMYSEILVCEREPPRRWRDSAGNTVKLGLCRNICGLPKASRKEGWGKEGVCARGRCRQEGAPLDLLRTGFCVQLFFISESASLLSTVGKIIINRLGGWGESGAICMNLPFFFLLRDPLRLYSDLHLGFLLLRWSQIRP